MITYAHIAHETGHAGFALQYWFFWYFNQFNDLHEGDWEGMQLAWESAPCTCRTADTDPGSAATTRAHRCASCARGRSCSRSS